MPSTGGIYLPTEENRKIREQAERLRRIADELEALLPPEERRPPQPDRRRHLRLIEDGGGYAGALALRVLCP